MSGDTRTKKVEYHLFREPLTVVDVFVLVSIFYVGVRVCSPLGRQSVRFREAGCDVGVKFQ